MFSFLNFIKNLLNDSDFEEVSTENVDFLNPEVGGAAIAGAEFTVRRDEALGGGTATNFPLWESPVPINLPLYESGREKEGNEEDTYHLTAEELVEETDSFMKSFMSRIDTQTMPDTIFFLDKSARPAAYLFRKLFPVYYPDQKRPTIRYVNIGRPGDRELGKFDKPFDNDPSILTNVYGPHIKQNERIMVVDEHTESGGSLEDGKRILSAAFPSAILEGAVAYSKLPAWHEVPAYLGVEEYTGADYRSMSLEKLSEETGESYTSIGDVLNSSRTIIDRYHTIKKDLDASIPFSKKSDTNVSQSREELDSVCQEIIRRRKDV